MDLSQVIILSIIEGVTEFLPISSTGHLIIAEKLLGWKVPFAFDLIIQVGAFCAVIFLFHAKIFKILMATKRFILYKLTKSAFEEKDRIDARLGMSMLIATIPIAIIGVVLQGWIEKTLHTGLIVSIFLILFSFVMAYFDKRADGKKTINETTSTDVLKIGLWQVISLIPGVSRSGATIVGGMAAGLSRETAAEVSFILGVPLVLGAGLKGVFDLVKGKEGFGDITIFQVGLGFLISFAVGMIVIKFLLNFVKNNNFKPFIWYRIGLGVFLLMIFLIVGGK